MKKEQEIIQYIELIPVRLRAVRQARGFKNSTVFAEIVQRKRTTYRSHEQGEVMMGISDAIHYSKILNISLSWLLTGEGTPFDHYTKPPSQKEQDDLDYFLQIAIFKSQFKKNKIRKKYEK